MKLSYMIFPYEHPEGLVEKINKYLQEHEIDANSIIAMTEYTTGPQHGWGRHPPKLVATTELVVFFRELVTEEDWATKGKNIGVGPKGQHL